MNTPDPELQISPPLPLDTHPQATEPEVVPPVAEEGSNKVPPKAKAKTSTYKKPPATERTPPEVLGIFLGEEDRRMLKKMNQIMVNRLGIKKNNSFKI